MSQTPTTLRSVLESCDMLIIDDLHAWQFTLNDAEPALLIECMDGRNRRVWSFTAEELAAARQDGDDWQLRSAQGEHRLQCLGAEERIRHVPHHHSHGVTGLADQGPRVGVGGIAQLGHGLQHHLAGGGTGLG